MIGALFPLLFVTTTTTQTGAGRGRRLADYEAEWELRRSLEPKPTRKQKAKAKREYFPRQELPEVAQAYVETLQRRVEDAKLAEMRALLDLQVKEITGRTAIAWAAVEIARARQKEAMRRLEEFDIVYIAAMIAAED